MNHCLFKIIGIDPGGNTGLSIYTIDDYFNIINIEPLTLKLDSYYDINIRAASKSVERLTVLDSIISELMEVHEPIAVAMETAFVNSRFPAAGLHLAKYTAIIDVAIRKVAPRAIVFRFPPKYIKSEVGAGGKAFKDDMLSNLYSIPDVNKFIKDNDNLDEHNVDATAIAYVALNEIKRDPSILVTMRD